MSRYRYIHLRSRLSKAETIERISTAIEWKNILPGPYDSVVFVGNDFQAFADSVTPRGLETPTEYWEPPFDLFNFDLRFQSFGNKEREHLAADTVFEVLKSTNNWTMALSDDGFPILKTFYPDTSEGRADASRDDDERRLKRLPQHRHHVLIGFAGSLESLGEEVAKVAGPEWQRAGEFTELPSKLIFAYEFSLQQSSFSVELNEIESWKRTRLAKSFDFRISTFSMRGQLGSLDLARELFVKLKDVGRWPLVLTEDLKKALDRFDPNP